MSHTPDEVLELADSAMREQFSTYHDHVAKERLYYRGHQIVKVPDGFNKIVTPYGRIMGNAPSDHIITQYPYVEVPMPRGPERDPVRLELRAEKLRSLHQTFLARAAQSTRRGNPVDAAKGMQVRYGLGVLKVLPRTTYWKEKPDGTPTKRQLGPFEQEFPILMRSVDPAVIAYDLYHDPPEWCIESYKMAAGDAFALYPDLEEVGYYRYMNRNTMLDYVECWYEDEVVYLWNGEEVFRWKHGWKFLPYVPFLSGFGEDASDAGFEEQAVGILRDVVDSGVLDENSRTMSQVAAMMAKETWGTLLVPEGMENEIEEGIGVVLGVPENILRAGPDMFRRLQGAGVNSQLLSYHAMTQDMIFNATAPRSVQGIRQPGTSSALETELNLDQARLRYGAALQRVQAGVETANSMMAWMCEHVIAEPVPIWGGIPMGDPNGFKGQQRWKPQEISPEEIGGHYVNYVTFRTSGDADADRRILAGERLTNHGLPDQTFLLEYGGVSNPQEQATMKAAEDLLKAEPMVQAMSQEAAEILRLEMAEAKAEMQKKGGPGTLQTPEEIAAREALRVLLQGLREMSPETGMNYQPPGSIEEGMLQNRRDLVGAMTPPGGEMPLVG